MKPVFRWAAILMAGLMLAGGAFAEDYRIGYVNTARILKESKVAKLAQQKLETEFSKRDGELKKINDRVLELQNDLERNGATMPESTRRDKERSLTDLSIDLERKRRDFGVDLNRRRNEELSVLQDRTNKAIQKIAEERNFDLIVQEPVVYASKRIEITDMVISTLDGNGNGR
ncbi:MAG: OmpH family outer membrane protein [Burkholderiales bacterium]|nr:OmpH family outer membrane protein [Burkholderiales bacterium]